MLWQRYPDSQVLTPMVVWFYFILTHTNMILKLEGIEKAWESSKYWIVHTKKTINHCSMPHLADCPLSWLVTRVPLAVRGSSWTFSWISRLSRSSVLTSGTLMPSFWVLELDLGTWHYVVALCRPMANCGAAAVLSRAQLASWWNCRLLCCRKTRTIPQQSVSSNVVR